MTELKRKRLEWKAYRLEPDSNPLVYGHPEMYGEIILENALCFFLADSSEIPGSGMILPKGRRETVFDLTRDEWNATFDLLLEVKSRFDSMLEPDGYNIGWNVGPVGGGHIPQAHLHVIPRFEDEPFAGRGIRWWFKQPENARVQEGISSFGSDKGAH
jgi:diadenosine tetraphosphate (Ap4A) HIT family hydrolase